MKTIGITGGVGAGKSTVLAYLEKDVYKRQCYGRCMVSGDPDCGFTVEFHYFLLWNKGFQPV